jgi:hypothetical protein
VCQVRKQTDMIVLTLSSERICNTVITNEQGVAVYRTDNPLLSSVTTIHKLKPNAERYDMGDQFEVMAEIEWHTFTSTKVRFGGTEVDAKRFIESKGWTGR